jgi:tetratricopeptide (TPR) repeat protein
MELEPGNADVMVDQARVWALQGRYRKAVDLMERAMKLDPLNSNTIIRLSEVYEATGRQHQSIQILESALEVEPDNASLISSVSWRQADNGQYAKAVATLQDLLAREPDYIVGWTQLFNLYFDMGDLASAEFFLQSIEALSKDRAADERALYCYVLQDESCWHAAVARMLASRKAFFVQTFQSRMMLEDGNLDDAIAVMLPIVEYFQETGDQYGNYGSRINLATLYHLAGDHEQRDRTLEKAVNAVQFGIEHGWESWSPYYYLAMAAASTSDTANAVQNLQQAYQRGYRRLWYIDFDYAWDPIRGNAEFQSLVQRIEAANAAMLEQLKEMERNGELPPLPR